MIDENSYYLSEHEFEQDRLQKQWLDSLPIMRDEIIEHTINCLNGDICQEEFDWIFSRYVESDHGYEQLSSVLDQWIDGDINPEDEPFLNQVVLVALEGSSEVMFGESLYEIASEGGFSINKMIAEVIG